MKKIFLLLLLAVSFTISAQDIYSIAQPLKLKTVHQSTTLEDSVLVYTSAKMVKFAPRSAFSSSDATTTTKGVIKLAGDLAGTANAPTVPGLATKQEALVSGTNIKTVNGVSLLGSGDVPFAIVSGSVPGIVDNTSLQELGGVDKSINGVRIGRGATNTVSNTVVGASSMNNVSSGNFNVSVGYFAGNAITTGSTNTAMGGSALPSTTTGLGNTAIGSAALFRNVTGSYNTALGGNALNGRSGGTNANSLNIGIGNYAGISLFSGDNNIFMGAESTNAAGGLDTGSRNIVIGKVTNNVVFGDANTFVGRYTAPANTTMSANIIISDGNGIVGIRKTDTHQLLAPSLTIPLINSGGVTSLVTKEYADQPVSVSTSGIVNNTLLQELGGVDKSINGVRIGKGLNNNANNTALGNNTLAATLAAGIYNTAVGAYAGYAITTGQQNTAVGLSSISATTTGSNNTAMGTSVLFRNTTGSYNTAIGNGALTGQPSATGNSRNIGLGSFAGNNINTGSDNILIGSESAGAVGLQNGNNNTIVGKINNGHTTGDANTFLGKVTSPSSTLSANIIISDGNGIVGVRKTDTHQLLAPSLTQALVVSGGNTSLTNKEYVDNGGAIDNSTTTALSGTALNSTYPNALLGFRVQCLSISGGGLVYEKTTGGWVQYSASTVAP